MTSLPIGFVIISAVITYALMGAKLSIFLNLHSIILVIGGTLGVFAISVPMQNIKNLMRSILAMGQRDTPLDVLHKDILALSKRKDAPTESAHPLIEYAQELWSQGLEDEIFVLLMRERMRKLNAGTEQAVAELKNLAKYPPAMGMTGTVVGMVTLFSSLTPDNRSNFGPALAMAMTATFYGLILANAIIMPLADRLHVISMRRMKADDHIFQAILLIQDGEPISIVEEGLNAAA